MFHYDIVLVTHYFRLRGEDEYNDLFFILTVARVRKTLMQTCSALKWYLHFDYWITLHLAHFHICILKIFFLSKGPAYAVVVFGARSKCTNLFWILCHMIQVVVAFASVENFFAIVIDWIFTIFDDHKPADSMECNHFGDVLWGFEGEQGVV